MVVDMMYENVHNFLFFVTKLQIIIQTGKSFAGNFAISQQISNFRATGKWLLRKIRITQHSTDRQVTEDC